MVCDNCGNTLKDSAKFCSGCGMAVGAAHEDSSVGAASLESSAFDWTKPDGLSGEAPADRCVAHPTALAAAQCQGCGSSVCSECLKSNGKYCVNCQATLPVSQPEGLQAYERVVAHSSPVLQIASQPQYYAQSVPDYRFAGLSPYYQQEFSQILASGESYKGKWNWAAFFFGSIWALTKGAWATFLVQLAIALIVGGVTCGFGLPLLIIFPIIYGVRGNYIYYSVVTKGKQLVF